MSNDLLLTLLAASATAFGLALLSAVAAGFGGGVLLLPVFTALLGLRFAVPMLTLTQLSSNASRVWLNRRRSSGLVWTKSPSWSGTDAGAARGPAEDPSGCYVP